MAELDGNLPHSDFLGIEPGGLTIGQYGLAKESHFDDACYEHCSPEARVNYCGQRAISEFLMKNALQGGDCQEVFFEIEVYCSGPRRKLLSGRECSAVMAVKQVDKPTGE